jgi:hypothetical protein
MRSYSVLTLLLRRISDVAPVVLEQLLMLSVSKLANEAFLNIWVIAQSEGKHLIR